MPLWNELYKPPKHRFSAVIVSRINVNFEINTRASCSTPFDPGELLSDFQFDIALSLEHILKPLAKQGTLKNCF